MKKTYSVHIHGLQAQQIDDILFDVGDLAPSRHLRGRQVARRVDVAEPPPPRGLAHVVPGDDLAAQLLLDVGPHGLARGRLVAAAVLREAHALKDGLYGGIAVVARCRLPRRWR
jgi:hypothetical protein